MVGKINSNTIISLPRELKDEFIYHLVENDGYIASSKQRDKMFEIAKSTTNINAVLFSIGALTYDTRKFLIYETSDFEIHKELPLPFGAVGIICTDFKKQRKEITEEIIQNIVKQILLKLKIITE